MQLWSLPTSVPLRWRNQQKTRAAAIAATSKTTSAVARVKDLRFMARCLRTRVSARDWLLIVRFADLPVRTEQTESEACTWV
jgi:hypothetical protein